MTTYWSFTLPAAVLKTMLQRNLAYIASITFSDACLLSLPPFKPWIKTLKVCCKCGAARIIQVGAARVDLCPKYAHASRGQECGAPKLIVRISGGLCVVYTAQRSGNSNLLPTDCCSFLRAVGALQRQRRTGRKSWSTNNTAACQTDKQWQAADTFFHTEANVWTAAVAGGSTSSWPSLMEICFILMLAVIGQIPEAVWKLYLFPCWMKAILLCYILKRHKTSIQLWQHNILEKKWVDLTEPQVLI